jgi:anti-sigma B factor antagonist
MVNSRSHGAILRRQDGLRECRALALQSWQEETDMGLRISVRKSGNVAILDVRGRIVIGESNDLFAAELRKLAECAPCDVLVNLAEVAQVDSTGISTLVKLFVTLRRDGGNLKILNPVGLVRQVLEVTTLIKCFPTYTDEAEALASFRGGAAHA